MPQINILTRKREERRVIGLDVEKQSQSPLSTQKQAHSMTLA
jgi:hypothetical protein